METINLVTRISFITTLTLGPLLVFQFRNRAINQIFRTINHCAIPLSLAPMVEQGKGTGSEPDSRDIQNLFGRAYTIFADLRMKIEESKRAKRGGSKPISLQLIRSSGEGRILPASLALDWKDSRVIAVKEDIVAILSDDELESVLAHELGHIEQGDAKIKSLATAFRISFLFNPLSYFAEAAIYREKELSADEYSAKITKKPISLACALLKIYQSFSKSKLSKLPSENLESVPSEVSLLIAAKNATEDQNENADDRDFDRGKSYKRSKLLSKQPTLLERIERLLELPM